MRITIRNEDHAAVVEIEGSLSSEEKLSFEREVSRVLEENRHAVLDLSGVTFIDSAALGAIVKFSTLFRANGRHLLLASVNRQIFEVLQLTGMTQQIPIFESPRDAVEYLARG